MAIKNGNEEKIQNHDQDFLGPSKKASPNVSLNLSQTVMCNYFF